VNRAVGIGAAFATWVTALVKGFITPLLAAIGGQRDFSALNFTVNHSTFLYGDFINTLISFVLLAAVIDFFVVAPFSNRPERYKPTPEEQTPVQDARLFQDQ